MWAIVKLWSTWGAVALGVIGAMLWIYASYRRIPPDPTNRDFVITDINDQTGKRTDVLATMRSQTFWNGWAAFATAAAALLQALATLAGQLGP